MVSIFGSAFPRGLAHGSHCSRASLPRYSQARPCFWQETLSVTARSPWNPRQAALEGQPGSSRVWPGSASCCRVFAEGEATLVRPASLDACPLALPAPPVSGLLSRRLQLGTFFFVFAIFLFLFCLDRSIEVGTELSFRVNEEGESRNNHRYAVVVQDLATQWIQSYPCKTKTAQESCKSFTLTVPWNLANPVKNYPGIILRQHRTDRKQMGLLREPYDE